HGAPKEEKANAGHSHHHDDLNGLLNKYDQRIEFVENKGQFSEQVLYRADFPLGQAVATPEGMLVTAFDPKAVEERQLEGIRIEEDIKSGKPHRDLKWQQKGHGWLMQFQGASPSMNVTSKD